MNVINTSTTPLWVCLIVVALGIFAHAISKLSELEQRGQPIDMKSYITNNKYTAMSVVLGAYMLFMYLWYSGQGSLPVAIMAGICCNTAGDKLRARIEAAK